MPEAHCRRTLFSIAAGGGLTALLAGCAAAERGTAVPRDRTMKATVLGLPNERFFPFGSPEPLYNEVFAAIQRQQRARGLTGDQLPPEWQILAVSGGGEDGAFGAGVLCGWTEAGTRPVFELATGVSTGALTAPFAFLGSAYDGQLRSVYTDLKPSHVLESRGLIVGGLMSDAMADNSPLYKTISRYLNTDMQAALAKGYNEGRLLLIGTTDLDAQVPVIWNIGAIAASNHPRALDTIRRVLLASAAVPGAFPPTMFDVTVDGVAYQEMHVDGGAFAQAFLYPASLTKGRRERMARGQPVIDINAYVIRNARLDPNWASVERRTLGIASRAISTMIASSGYNDVVRIYNVTSRDGVGFNLAYIGTDFTMVLPEPFDPGYMRALFDYGYQRARHGYPWAKRPPTI
jgi:predicted acylesterase/phospholipase RssA